MIGKSTPEGAEAALRTLADLCVKAYPGRLIWQIKFLRVIVNDLTGDYITLMQAKDVCEAAIERAKGQS